MGKWREISSSSEEEEDYQQWFTAKYDSKSLPNLLITSTHTNPFLQDEKKVDFTVEQHDYIHCGKFFVDLAGFLAPNSLTNGHVPK